MKPGLRYKELPSCAKQGIQIVLGSTVGSSSNDGCCRGRWYHCGVLADSLTKAAVSGKYRAGIRENGLLWFPYDPMLDSMLAMQWAAQAVLADYALVSVPHLNRVGPKWGHRGTGARKEFLLSVRKERCLRAITS